MEVLFADEQCWNLHDYTKHCAEVLRSGKLLFFYNGVLRGSEGAIWKVPEGCLAAHAESDQSM